MKKKQLSRKEFQALCYRILYGEWEADLRKALQEELGSIKAAHTATIDMSANLFRFVNTSKSVQYDDAPDVSAEQESEAVELFLSELNSEYWPLAQRVQRDTNGIREMLVRVSKTSKDKLHFRPVFPHYVDIVSDHEDPTLPVHICEQNCLTDYYEKERIVHEHFEVRGDYAAYWITDENNNQVVTEDFYDETVELEEGAITGDQYRWRYSDGTPFLPYVVYHAEQTGKLWDCFNSKELVEGTLKLGVLYSFLNHGVKHGVHLQKYALNAEPLGVTVKTIRLEDGTEVTTEEYEEVIADVSTILMFAGRKSQDGTIATPSLGALPAGFDPDKLADTLRNYEARLLNFAGIQAGDVIRASGDPGAAYALKINADAQRSLQMRFEDQFRKSDLELISKAAALFNTIEGQEDIPEQGYSITYTAVPMSDDEENTLLTRIEKLLSLQIIDLEQAKIMAEPLL